MGGGQARRIAGPVLGQIELTIDEGMPLNHPLIFLYVISIG
jgi:hypothetical protein